LTKIKGHRFSLRDYWLVHLGMSIPHLFNAIYSEHFMWKAQLQYFNRLINLIYDQQLLPYSCALKHTQFFSLFLALSLKPDTTSVTGEGAVLTVILTG